MDQIIAGWMVFALFAKVHYFAVPFYSRAVLTVCFYLLGHRVTQ